MTPRLVLHDPACWPSQRTALEHIASGKVKSGDALIKALLKTSFHEDRDYNDFAGICKGGKLCKALKAADPLWWDETLPHMANLALTSERLFPTANCDGSSTSPLHYLLPDTRATITLTRTHVASVLALAFFDAIPNGNLEPQRDMPDHLSFQFWLTDMDLGAEAHKVLCLAQYFAAARATFASDLTDAAIDAAVAAAATGAADDTISISRLVLKEGDRADTDTPSSWEPWLKCDAPLSALQVVETGGIEGATGALQADFANEYIGGGVLHQGNVQEEIRFTISPECLVSMLICPRMRPHEAILIRNVRQYSGYTGYGGGFRCTGPHDTTHGEAWAAGPASARAGPPEHVLAIDASCYYYVDSSTQYESPAMLRELTKLRAALLDGGILELEEPVAPVRQPVKRSLGADSPRAPPDPDDGGSSTLERRRAFATGNWGCGVFGGDARLKALLQWIAASRAGRPVLYYPFGDPRASGLAETAAKLLAANVTVGQLTRSLLDSQQEMSQGRAFACVEKILSCAPRE